MTPRAIETVYAGHRFRSRLEARWAVFFDTLNIPWEYEPEGFELPSGRYLPDFWLPGIGWYEVKGPEPTDREWHLIWEFGNATNDFVHTAVGPIPYDTNNIGRSQNPTTQPWLIHRTGDHDYAWCVCPWCGAIGLEYEARGSRICTDRKGNQKHDPVRDDPTTRFTGRLSDKGYTGDHPLIQAAYIAARSARFEHGETGR